MKKILLSTLFCTTTLFQAEAFASQHPGEQTPDVVKTKMKNLHEEGHFKGDSPFTKEVKEKVYKDKYIQEAKQEEHVATARKLFTTKIKDYKEKNEVITNEMKALRDNNEELRTTLDTSKAELENLRKVNLKISVTCDTLEAKKSEIEIELQKTGIELQKTTDSRTRNVTYLQSELSNTIQALATAKAELAASEEHIKAIEKAQKDQIKKLQEAKQNKKDDQQKGSPDGDEGKKDQSSDKTTSSSSTQGNSSDPTKSDDDSDYNSDDDVDVNIRGK